jgi:spermidine synthase
MPKYYIILFAFVLIEGFFTLSLELLSIRQIIPFVGSGTEMVSVAISMVLMPLAFGYYYGGKRYRELLKKKTSAKLRKILINNIFLIVGISGVGFSYIVMWGYFNAISLISSNLILNLAIYLLFFLAIPTFLLGQTVPLITNYFKSEDMSKTTGKILFISTLGSFLGSIITVLFLMRYIGVSHTLIFIEMLLLLLAVLISKKGFERFKNLSISILLIIILIGLKVLSYKIFDISYENKYNTVSILSKDVNNTNVRVLRVNGSFSSKIRDTKKDKFFVYVNKINKILSYEKGRKILVIGAGGFTVGFTDNNNEYYYIDIDPDLKNIAEKKFLKSKLHKNQHFIATEIRQFLLQKDRKFDIIVVDAYSNRLTIPQSLVTVEFYAQLKKALNKDGYIITNIIADRHLNSAFAIRIDNTLRAVFDNVLRFPLREESWNIKKVEIANILYILRDKKDKKVYTDDLNTCVFDKF